MTTYFSKGSETTCFSDAEIKAALDATLKTLGQRNRVLIVPPDFTRFPSYAGPITCMLHETLGETLVDVLPALGTHDPMTAQQLEKMFPTLPKSLIRDHRWREDVVQIGEVSAEYVQKVTEGIYNKPWPLETNRLIADKTHDLILSIGQVLPHEVIGMANYNKNIFVGTGGAAGINESHFISAAYGMERIMGRADNPLRQIFNHAEKLFCQDLPIVYVLTVVGTNKRGESVVRGLYIGDDPECFWAASELALKVNFELLDEAPEKIVVYLDPQEFTTTWLGNKSIYRTRMAIADQGELIVLAPGVKRFGEDLEIDRLIRKYGYRSSPEVLQMVAENQDLQANLSAAAHLIHGSSEGRFKITYAPGQMTREEIESVGYNFASLAEMTDRYDPIKLTSGWNCTAEGERFFFVSNPAQGLWAHRDRFENVV